MTLSRAMGITDEEEHGGEVKTSSVHESEPRRGVDSPSTKIMLLLRKPDKLDKLMLEHNSNRCCPRQFFFAACQC